MDKSVRILITGANGFLGKILCEKLESRGYNKLVTFRKSEYDITKEKDVSELFKQKGPFDVVIHLAASVGGIGFNKKNPGKAYYDNIMMNTLIQEYSRINKVSKFLGIGTVCSYPKYTQLPFKEENLWDGYPEETNASYGLAKKMMLTQSQAYRQQYGFNAIHLLMINLYGPDDNFDLESSHVIAALIRKFYEAKLNKAEKVVLWGDGTPSREFLYVKDAAEAIVLAMEKYNKPAPINIGSGEEIRIKDLADKIKKLTGFEGSIEWDISKPNGQPRRCLDISKAKKELGFIAKTSLDEGLRKTIEFYRKIIETSETKSNSSS